MREMRAIHTLWIVLCLRLSVVQASPFEDPSFGGSVFTGPTTAHATSILVNPAALGLATLGPHLYLGTNLRLDQYRITRKIITSPTGNLENGPTVRARTITPNALLAYYRGYQDFTLGLAFSRPLGEEYIADKEQLRYHTNGGDSYQYAVSVAGAYRIDRVIMGASVSWTFSTIALDFSRDTALDHGSDAPLLCDGVACGIENPLADQRIELEASTKGGLDIFSLSNFTFTLGGMVDLGEGWWIGASYLLVFAKQKLVGTIDITDPDGSQHSGAAEIQFRLPQVVHFGVRIPILRNYDLLTDIRWQNMSRHAEFDIRPLGREFAQTSVPEVLPRYRGFGDIWRFSAGLERLPHGPIRFGARLRLETAAVSKNEITPQQVAGLHLASSFGFEWRFSTHWGLQLGYDLSWFPKVDVTDSVFNPVDSIRCIDDDFALPSCRGSAEGRAIPTAAGTYRRWQHGFLLGLRYDSH